MLFSGKNIIVYRHDRRPGRRRRRAPDFAERQRRCRRRAPKRLIASGYRRIWRGARVLATAPGRDTAFVHSLGADVVIDYHTTLFEDTLRDIDMVLDTIGGETRRRSWRVLRKGGVLVTLVSPIPTGEAEQNGVRGIFFIVSGNRGQLDQISALVDGGKLKPLIAEVLPLAHGTRSLRTWCRKPCSRQDRASGSCIVGMVPIDDALTGN